MTDPGVGKFAELLGVRTVLMHEGRSTFELTVRPEHLNPYGVVHGGVVYALADQAMGGAMVTRLRPGERCATIEIKINYLASVSGGTLRAEAVVLERTNRLGVLEARVHAGDGRLLSIATGTYYISASPAP
ncbi:MAG: PaaI family thioesterase [Candidatus Rokubacteria bacterium]|nr:PaaI family thioesterase [Candidatus Rokubacteria bacterium]